jgi:hypothetical protein
MRRPLPRSRESRKDRDVEDEDQQSIPAGWRPQTRETLLMPVLLGAIADDFTGATDLANTLVGNRPGKLTSVSTACHHVFRTDSEIREVRRVCCGDRLAIRCSVTTPICSPGGIVREKSNTLTDVLGRIADHKITRLDERMPWRYAATAA